MCTYQSPALKEAPSPLPVRPIPPPAYALCDPVDCHPHQLLSECSRLNSAAQHSIQQRGTAHLSKQQTCRAYHIAPREAPSDSGAWHRDEYIDNIGFAPTTLRGEILLVVGPRRMLAGIGADDLGCPLGHALSSSRVCNRCDSVWAISISKELKRSRLRKSINVPVKVSLWEVGLRTWTVFR